MGVCAMEQYLDVAHTTANLGSLVVFFSFVLVIGLGLAVHSIKTNTNMLQKLVDNLTETNAAMLPQLSKLNESYERSMEILRQFGYNLDQNEKNIFVLQQKVNNLREELFKLDKIVTENKTLNEDFIKESKRRFQEIDENIVNILEQIQLKKG